MVATLCVCSLLGCFCALYLVPVLQMSSPLVFRCSSGARAAWCVHRDPWSDGGPDADGEPCPATLSTSSQRDKQRSNHGRVSQKHQTKLIVAPLFTMYLNLRCFWETQTRFKVWFSSPLSKCPPIIQLYYSILTLYFWHAGGLSSAVTY